MNERIQRKNNTQRKRLADLPENEKTRVRYAIKKLVLAAEQAGHSVVPVTAIRKEVLGRLGVSVSVSAVLREARIHGAFMQSATGKRLVTRPHKIGPFSKYGLRRYSTIPPMERRQINSVILNLAIKGSTNKAIVLEIENTFGVKVGQYLVAKIKTHRIA